MSESMIERVAKAMFEATPFKESAGSWSDQSGTYQRMCKLLARAAIEAMREPTEAMLATQGKSRPDKAKTEATRRMAERLNAEMRQIATEVWNELIDAALNQTDSEDGK